MTLGALPVGYVLLTEIEDRTQALARLQQMQSDFAHINRVSMMGELAASLSREITQPIASARDNARAAQNFLKMQPPDLGEVREALSCVVGDLDRAGDIIYRVREHMKKAPPRKAHFDLNAAINEVIVLARSVIIRNGVSVHTRFADGLLPADGDRIQLQQVVLNAVEAMDSVESGARELLISSAKDHTGGRKVSGLSSLTRGKSRMHQRARTDLSGGRGVILVPRQITAVIQIANLAQERECVLSIVLQAGWTPRPQAGLVNP
jgi:phosphoglycerate-specific signal transduction histidine kinase